MIRFLIIPILVLGIFFRFANIDSKVYWHDEVYTSIRATGYQGEEIGQKIFSNRIITPQELQQFQKLKSGSTALDTIQSLAIEDPQHPPFYFLLDRFWESFWGYSLVSSRILPIIISLLSLPLIYFLALELFSSKLSAIIATILLAISPFDILFAQIARQYSLLTFTVILSYLFLWRSLQNHNRLNWIFYTLACTLGLYTHVFFALTLIAQLVFIIFYAFLNQENYKKIILFLLSFISAIILYLPWLIILYNNRQKALSSTSWAVSKLDIVNNIKLWILSFTSLFTDIDFGFNNPLTYLYRVLFILLIALSIYTIYRKTDRITYLLIITSIFIPFFLLVIPDIILETRRSTITRYLISCFPGVQLAVAYFLADKLSQRQRVWQIIFALILTNSIISNSINAVSEITWAKVPSHLNAITARVINSASSPLVISDRGGDWTNLGDLISLSYLLDDDVKLYLTGYPADRSKLETVINKPYSEILVFRPSQSLRLMLEDINNKPLKISENSGDLWKIF